jgi:SanA protein
VRRALRLLLLLAAAVGSAGLIFVLGLRAWVHASYGSRVYSRPAEVPACQVGIVFGASVRGDRPSRVLADRVAAAADLYRAGKVRKLLMTGDNRFVDYNEPAAMIAYARELGVPDQDLIADYAGRRTYDSCYRAREIFGVKEAVLVTQSFHLDRALFISDALGIEAVGYSADRRSYPIQEQWWSLREMAALVVAWWDVNVSRPAPVLGEPIPIPD